jgi:hypothetical protein
VSWREAISLKGERFSLKKRDVLSSENLERFSLFWRESDTVENVLNFYMRRESL